MSARRDILERAARALADRPRPPAVPRDYRRAPADATDAVALFAERAADYRAVVERVDVAQLAERVAAALSGGAPWRVVVPHGVPAQWLTEARIEALSDDPPLTTEQLDRADAVLTGAALAIAETGTIVLDAGAAQGRRALTLLPDRHVCVVRAEQVVTSVPQAIERLDPRRPQTWISGPSATSDIELNRVEGVHGPRNLHIIIAS